jgi:hypothetical protein
MTLANWVAHGWRCDGWLGRCYHGAEPDSGYYGHASKEDAIAEAGENIESRDKAVVTR